MKTIYLQCNMGAAGDMLMAALLELHPDPVGFLKRLNSIGIPDVKIEAEKCVKCGITGTHMRVLIYGEEESGHVHSGLNAHTHSHDGHHHDENQHLHEHTHSHKHTHHHSGMGEIEHIISHLDISANVRKNALAVYRLIAEAESYAHGCEMEYIHFHEVGTMDAVTDVVGACMLFEEIGAEKVIASPVHVGCGQVKCAHGILPVPAPATEFILRGIPVYGGDIMGELCTPTGAALLKHFVSEFGAMPVMKVSKTGYGMGSKDFEAANCLRAMFGETENTSDTVAELCCNIDDMTGEEIGYAVKKIMDSGALDVYTVPINMKKNRPGVLLNVMCGLSDREKMLKLIFKHTSTIGVRENISNRYTLERKKTTLETRFGDIRAKASTGYGVSRVKAEYEDMAEIANKCDMPLSVVKKEVEKIFSVCFKGFTR